MRYEITYRGSDSETPRAATVTSKRLAIAWARAYVTQSYRDSARATVHADGEIIRHYRNMDGRAVAMEV